MTSPLQHMIGFVIATDFEKARKFYGDALGFRAINENHHGMGIWTTPEGAEVAWFKDLEGNTLSISKHPD